jgi:arylsulfatase A-like enzyme
VDDLGWTDLGYPGSSFLDTRNIDELAKEGMVFIRAYAAVPNCSPKASVMTRNYPLPTGITKIMSEHHRLHNRRKDTLLLPATLFKKIEARLVFPLYES